MNKGKESVGGDLVDGHIGDVLNQTVIASDHLTGLSKRKYPRGQGSIRAWFERVSQSIGHTHPEM